MGGLPGVDMWAAGEEERAEPRRRASEDDRRQEKPWCGAVYKRPPDPAPAAPHVTSPADVKIKAPIHAQKPDAPHWKQLSKSWTQWDRNNWAESKRTIMQSKVKYRQVQYAVILPLHKNDWLYDSMFVPVHTAGMSVNDNECEYKHWVVFM